MTVSPLPGTVQRGDIMRAAKVYVPEPKPDRVGGTLLILAGAVLMLCSLGLLIFGL
jgi:hypothetical protein